MIATIKILAKVLCIAALMPLVPGCSLNDHFCKDTNVFTVTVKVLDADGNDVTEQVDVADLSLFIFCNQDRYLQTLHMSGEDVRARKPFSLEYEKVTNIQVVGWGNIQNPNIEMDPVGEGAELTSQLYVSLIDHAPEPDSREEETPDIENRSPGDIYHGFLGMEESSRSALASHEIVLRPKMGKINVTTRHLRQWSDCWQWSRFSFVVYGTRDRMTFAHGLPEGDPAVYRPQLSLEEEENIATVSMTSFPCWDQPVLELRIYKDREEIYRVSEFDDGTPFKVGAGETIDIYADFSGDGTVKVTVEPWDDIGQGTDF